MRVLKILLVGLAGLAAFGLAGCEAPTSPSANVATGPPISKPSHGPARTEPTAAPARPANPEIQASARAVATRFYDLYFAGQFESSWKLLAAKAKGQVPLGTWVAVHNACAQAGAGRSGVVKSVTAFGNAAIVTESVTGAAHRRGTIAAVFNYSKGYWGYSPSDISIYRHGSVNADVAAARAAGLCSDGKISML
jgi:hypothetical protein